MDTAACKKNSATGAKPKEARMALIKYALATSLVGGLALGSATIRAQPLDETGGGQAALADKGPAPSVKAATVSVDFGVSRGILRRTERYNNLTRAHRYVDQRDADVQFYNEQGLHGAIYRTWIIVEDIYDFSKSTYNYTGIDDYLGDVSRLSDELLVVLDTRASMGKLGRTPEQIREPVKTILRYIKERHPQIRYIEPFNEPDHNLRQYMSPERLYDYYRV
jgi:hypothetical protein